MKKIVTASEIALLREADDRVKGTNDYTKYHMMIEYKTKVGGRWSPWKFLTWSVPYPQDMKVSKFKDKIFLSTEGHNVLGNEEITRYTLTEEVNKILKVYEEV